VRGYGVRTQRLTLARQVHYLSLDPLCQPFLLLGIFKTQLVGPLVSSLHYTFNKVLLKRLAQEILGRKENLSGRVRKTEFL
jgi:hypothetical protein